MDEKLTKAETVAAQLAAVTEQNFQFLMKRFDNIEKQNSDQLTLLREHIKESDKVNKVVERHTAYFGIMGLGVAPVLGWIAYKLGIKQ